MSYKTKLKKIKFYVKPEIVKHLEENIRKHKTKLVIFWTYFLKQKTKEIKKINK